MSKPKSRETSDSAVSAMSSITSPRAAVAAASDGSVLPRPQAPFQGKVGRTVKDSTPDFPKPYEAPAGSPNILLIMTDDVGFGASSTFGGPIQTPNSSASPTPAFDTTCTTPPLYARRPERP